MRIRKGYYIIIRGPLGCGKTTISERLSKSLKAKYFAIDKILEDNNIEEWEKGYVSVKSFIKANEIAIPEARTFLDKGNIVIFDGNFYFEEQIEDLTKKLDYPHYIFTLKAPLDVCIKRDAKRKNGFGRNAAKAVYNKVAKFDYGINIDIDKPIQECIKDISSHLK